MILGALKNYIFLVYMNDWIKFVKKVQAENGCSYKDAMIKASELRKKKGGAVWSLSEEDKKRYIRDKNDPKHQIQRGSATFWDPDSY